MARSPYKYFEPRRIAKLKNVAFLARQTVEGFISGLHRSPHRGFSVEFSEHREYAPGDDIRHLDWIAWARSDRYYVKQYQQETNLRAHILLDSSNSMNYQHAKSPTKLAYGSFLAACIAYLLSRQQDAVGAIAFDTKVRFELLPASTTAHLERLFRHLETLKPGKRTAIAKNLHQLANRIHKRGLAIIISDLYDDQEDILRALQHFVYKKHQVIIFHVMDRAELEFPFTRMHNFVDMETDQRMRVDARSIRQPYLRELQSFIDRYRRRCAEQNIEYVLAPTDVPYDQMLLHYLAKRRSLRR